VGIPPRIVTDAYLARRLSHDHQQSSWTPWVPRWSPPAWPPAKNTGRSTVWVG